MAGFDPTASTIRIQRMLNARRPGVQLTKLTPIASKPPAIPNIRRAEGGIVDSPAAPVTGPIVTATGGRTDAHPVHVPSGAYVLPADVVSHIGEGNSLAGMEVLKEMFGAPWDAKGGPLGAAMPKMAIGPGPRKPKAPYPALAIPQPRPGAMFALGGNAVSGLKLRTIGPNGSWGASQKGENARGGHVQDTGESTPIMISGGEFVISPEEVTRRGGGNINKGHKALDAWVLHLRKKSIETLKNLPGPAK